MCFYFSSLTLKDKGTSKWNKKKTCSQCGPCVPRFSQHLWTWTNLSERWNSEWQHDFGVQPLECEIRCFTDKERVADFVELYDVSTIYKRESSSFLSWKKQTFISPFLFFHFLVKCDELTLSWGSTRSLDPVRKRCQDVGHISLQSEIWNFREAIKCCFLWKYLRDFKHNPTLVLLEPFWTIKYGWPHAAAIDLL